MRVPVSTQPHGSSTTPKFGFSRPSSYHGDSPSKHLGEYFGGSAYKETEEERDRREWEKEKKRRRKAREKKKAQEVFITMHVRACLPECTSPLSVRELTKSCSSARRSRPFSSVSSSS